MLVDSHCHLDRVSLKAYDKNFSRFMTETLSSGVGRMLCVAIDLEHYPKMRALVEPYPQVSVSVGVHPNEVNRHEPEVEELVALAADPRNVAIGETGLDYYRSEGDLAWQHQRFRNHIAAAKACGKPLIIHTREARADTLRILREEGAREVGGVLHCFTEDWDMASQALDLGFYISFSGIITFPGSDELRQVAARLGRHLNNARTVTMRGDTAIIPITGPIFRRANLFTEISGATSECPTKGISGII